MHMKQEYTPRQQAKRDQIREGAKRVFLKKGFAEASTDAIAAEAGVSKQTLYTYYPTKEDLLADVLRYLMGSILHSWPRVTNKFHFGSKEELRQAFTEMAERMIANMMQPEYLSLLRVIVAEATRLPQLGNLFRETVAERALGSVGSILEQARGKTVADHIHAEVASRLFVGYLLTHAILGGLLVPSEQQQRPDSATIKAMVDLYLKAIT
jgi:TetR/AcrR family transcriptional repressor of mexJK operon